MVGKSGTLRHLTFNKFYSMYERQSFQVTFVRSILPCLFYYMFLNIRGSYTETLKPPACINNRFTITINRLIITTICFNSLSALR